MLKEVSFQSLGISWHCLLGSVFRGGTEQWYWQLHPEWPGLYQRRTGKVCWKLSISFTELLPPYWTHGETSGDWGVRTTPKVTAHSEEEIILHYKATRNKLGKIQKLMEKANHHFLLFITLIQRNTFHLELLSSSTLQYCCSSLIFSLLYSICKKIVWSFHQIE